MLVRLVPDIRKTAGLVSEITAACREQDAGSDQVNQAIQQLDKVAQQNAAASEQMSATSEELAAQAAQLQASIGYFHIDERAAVAPLQDVPATRPLRVATAAARPFGARAGWAPAPVVARKGGNGLAKNGMRGMSSGQKGYSLDLVAESDARDGEFVRY